jgi:hypothetical protein
MRLGLCALILASLLSVCAATSFADEPYVLTGLEGFYYTIYTGRSAYVYLDQPSDFIKLSISSHVDSGYGEYRVFDAPPEDWGGNPPYHVAPYSIPGALRGSILGQNFDLPQSGPFAIVIRTPSPIQFVDVMISFETYYPPPPVTPYGYTIWGEMYPTGYVGSATLITPEPSSLTALALGGVGMLIGLLKRRW